MILLFHDEAPSQLRNDEFYEKKCMDDEEPVNPHTVLNESAVTLVGIRWLISCIHLTGLAAGKTSFLGVSLREVSI